MGKSRKHGKKKQSSKEKHKHKADKSKKKAKKSKKEIKRRTSKEKHSETEDEHDKKRQKEAFAFAIPVELMNSKSHAPETPQEYERRQSEIRRMTDPVTGRTRIIKGDGEVLEEIVSRSRHTEINKKATQEDGRFFEANTLGMAAKQNR